LEKRAEQVLPGREGGEGEREGAGAGGEMSQTMYAHRNIRIKKNKKQQKQAGIVIHKFDQLRAVLCKLFFGRRWLPAASDLVPSIHVHR
jgi:hypothetical protein